MVLAKKGSLPPLENGAVFARCSVETICAQQTDVDSPRKLAIIPPARQFRQSRQRWSRWAFASRSEGARFTVEKDFTGDFPAPATWTTWNLDGSCGANRGGSCWLAIG